MNGIGIDMSLSVANTVSFWSNWMLIFALACGLVATYGIVVSANVKERFADERVSANELATAKANDSAKEADARAAEATLKAETERVERLKLEAKYAPRIITDEQVATLTVALAPLKGQSVDVISYETLGTDVAEYAFVLTANLNHAGLPANQFTPFSGSGLVWGVMVQTEEGSPQERGSILAAALKDAGIPVGIMAPFPVGQPIAGGYMGPTGVAPTAKLRLLVGAKPQPSQIPGTP